MLCVAADSLHLTVKLEDSKILFKKVVIQGKQKKKKEAISMTD